jgi:hypothetical protein
LPVGELKMVQKRADIHRSNFYKLYVCYNQKSYLVLPEKEYNYLILLLKILFLKARFCNFLSSNAQKVAISGSTPDQEGSGKRR